MCFLQIEKVKPTYQDTSTLKFVWVVLLFVGYKWRGNRQQTNVIFVSDWGVMLWMAAILIPEK